MPQYVVTLSHSPHQCPASNSKVRELQVKTAAELPQMARKSGIKFLAGPFVLMTEHEAIAAVEAPSVEAVNEFILRSGFMQWNNVRISVATSMEQALKEMEKMPPPMF